MCLFVCVSYYRLYDDDDFHGRFCSFQCMYGISASRGAFALTLNCIYSITGGHFIAN